MLLRYFKRDSIVYLPVTSVLFFLRRQKEKVPKEKGDFFAIAPRQKKGSTLCEQFAIQQGGAGFPPIACYYLALCKIDACTCYIAFSRSSTPEKGAIIISTISARISSKSRKIEQEKMHKTIPHLVYMRCGECWAYRGEMCK